MRHVLLLWAAASGWAQGPVAGSYAAASGAGAAVAAERVAWGHTPAALGPRGFGALLHFHRPFGMEALSVAEAGVAYDGGRPVNRGVSLAWRQVRVDGLYLENGWEAQAARRWGGAGKGFPGTLDVGAAAAWHSVRLAGNDPVGTFRHGYGAVWRPAGRLAVGGFARELPGGAAFAQGWRSGWEESGAVWQWGVEASGGGGQSLRFDLRKTGTSPWRTLASLGWSPHPSLEAVAGLASAPFQVSLGARAAWAGLSAHQALRRHRYLGSTGLASITWKPASGIDNGPPFPENDHATQ